MSKYIIKFIVLLVTVFSLLQGANAVSVNNNASFTTNCNEANVAAHYYIPNGQNSISFYPLDRIGGISKLLFIRDAETSVKIWNNTAGAMSCGSWWRVSNVVPPNTNVMAVGGNACVLKKVKRVNMSRPSAQITYKVAYKRETGFVSPPVLSNYYYYTTGNTQYKIPNQNRRTWGPVEYTGNECFNVYTHWCGDGVKDSSYGETCDPADPSKSGWGNGGCSTTCEPITVTQPKCGTANGKTYSYSQTTWPAGDTFCSVGTPTPNPPAFPGQGGATTWTCNSGSQSVSCSASRGTPPPADPKCNSLYASPTIGEAPLISNFSCNATNASSYKLEIKDSSGIVIKTIINRTGSYKFSDSGVYTVQCFVNNTVTSSSCKKAITVKKPTPPASCNYLTATPENGNAPLLSTFKCGGTRAYDYTIKVRNSSGKVLKVINSQSGQYVFYNPGTYTAQCYINGIITSNSCKQTIDVEPSMPEDPECGNANGKLFPYDATEWGSDDVFCAKGTPSPNPPQFPGQGATTVWTCETPGASPAYCSADREKPPVLATCDNLVANPDNGELPLATSFSCSGTNANKYRIELEDNNGDIFHIFDGQLGQYEFSSPGEYRAICYINGNITSPSCKKQITVNPPSDPECGNANGKLFPYDATGWGSDDVFCSEGTPSPNPPQFPNMGATTNWTCEKSGTSPAYCSADRDVPPVCVSGGLTGVQNSVVTENTLGLCPVGQTVGNFIAEVIGNTTNYSWSCNGLVGGNCYASYTSGGGGSSGGGQARCLDIEATVTDTSAIVKCLGNYNTRSFKVDCGNGDETAALAVADSNNSTLRMANFNCDYSTSPRTTSNTPKCYVSGFDGPPDVNAQGRWGSVAACEYKDVPYCGDLVIQTDIGEECDLGEKNGESGYACDINCKFTGGGGGSGGGNTDCRDTNSCISTTPNDGALIFGPQDAVIIGDGVNPFVKIDTKSYIWNKSDYDFSFDKLCVSYKSGSTLDYRASKVKCKNLPDILYPGQRVEFDSYPNYVGNKDKITSGSYGDNLLVTTLKNDETLYDDAYFASPFYVRVSKPSIVTTGGGTSYLKDSNKIANINDVAKTNKDENKNFVGVGVGGDSSSFSDTTNDSNIVDNTKELGDNYNNDLSTVVDDNGGANGTSKKLSDFESYNGIENVFILKNKNFRINDSTLSGKTGARTYIIENANLYIDGNISYLENIAFVVKGGNIIIDKDVENINGTYIAIAKNGRGGEIISGETDKQLKVKGSLYGNIDNLVDNRVYIEDKGGNLSVGTIVSFGSALFRKPAPLVSQFITEYINSKKVAK